MTEEIQETIEKKSFEKFYNRIYLILLIIPVLLLILSLIYLYSFSQQHGDLIRKDITLTGGTSIQVNSDIDITELRNTLNENFEDVSIRQISDIFTGEQIAFVIETTATPEEITPFLENYLGFKLTDENSSLEFTGSSLSGSFYNQLKFAILLSFIFMSIVVFLIFRTFIPSTAVIFSAFTDIVLTLVIVDLMGITVSTAGIDAFLMLIGYSVDTDILLTTRLLKRKEGSVNSAIFSAFKTGITMTFTSLVVVIIGFYIMSSLSDVFKQIFTILAIGLVMDILNTWFTNASFLKLYAEKMKK